MLTTVSYTGEYEHPYYAYADEEQYAAEGVMPEEEFNPNDQ